MTFIFPTCKNMVKYVYKISCLVKHIWISIKNCKYIWYLQMSYQQKEETCSQREKITLLFKILLKKFKLKIKCKKCQKNYICISYKKKIIFLKNLFFRGMFRYVICHMSHSSYITYVKFHTYKLIHILIVSSIKL